MKVGTDAVILGSWANPLKAQRILDIGTGTGIIAIMLAQKSQAIIDAIDIEAGSFQQASENFRFSPWNERLHPFHLSFQEFGKQATPYYDLIITNPPYFIDSSKASSDDRTQARHNDSLPFEDLLEGVLRLLHPKGGQFCLILPTKEATIFKALAESRGLFLQKMLRIKTKESSAVEKRQCMQLGFEKNPDPEDKILTIEKEGRHEYTTEYKSLTKDYYINF